MAVFPSLAAMFIGLAMLQCSVRAQITKDWLTNTNYDNPKNWDRGYPPCLTNNVIFPGDLNLPVALPETLIQVKSIVLPRAGVVVLPGSNNNNKKDASGVTLTSKSIHASCDGGDVTFTRKGVAYWTDPKQWSGWTEATPHLERVPCSTDVARFPDHSTFYVATPRKQPTVAFVEIEGQRLSGKLLTSVLTSSMGTEEFPTGEFITATGKTCQDESGCECDNDFLTEEICLHATPSLSQCDNPVKPIGFCHSICGAYFLFLNGSVDKVKKFVEGFPGAKDVISHVSKTSGFLQIVLTEKEDTSGSTEQIASELNNALLDSSLVAVLKNMNSLHVSGMKYGQISLLKSFGDFTMMALGAAFCFILLICIYQNDTSFLQYLNLGNRVYDGTLSFARFENHGEAVDLIQDVAPGEEENQSSGIAFQNILYSEGRQHFQDVTLSDLNSATLSTDGPQVQVSHRLMDSISNILVESDRDETLLFEGNEVINN